MYKLNQRTVATYWLFSALRLSMIGVLSLVCSAIASAEDSPSATQKSKELGAAGVPLKEAKLIIEHNATDEDTGFQGFVDGEAWNSLTIQDPLNRPVFNVRPLGTLSSFGLTELFFETREPPNAQVPIPDVLARLPQGNYSFVATNATDESQMRRTATFSHVIPQGPHVLSPLEGEMTGTNVLVRWEPVTQSLTGEPVTIKKYHVLAVDANPPTGTRGFFREEFSVTLPSTSTQVDIPDEFLQPGKDYHLEVFALADAGNQTFTLVHFRVR